MHTVWMHIVQFHWNLCINVNVLHLVYLLASFIQYERIAEDMSLMFFHLLVTLSQDPGQTWPMTDEGVVWHISHMHTHTHQQSVVFIRALQEFDYNQRPCISGSFRIDLHCLYFPEIIEDVIQYIFPKCPEIFASVATQKSVVGWVYSCIPMWKL